jgi:hypothetical protein
VARVVVVGWHDGANARHACSRSHQDGSARERLCCQSAGNGLASRSSSRNSSPGAATPANSGLCSQYAREQRGGGGGSKCRHQHSQLLPSRGDRSRECTAPCATAQVCPHAPAAKRSAVAVGDGPAHLLTHHRTTLLELQERAARLEDGLLRGSNRHLERDAYLLV